MLLASRDISSGIPDQRHLDDLWWLLHRSEDPNRRTALLTCYIDESGTDSNSTIAVVGGKRHR